MMRPPICAICNLDFIDNQTEGGLVLFKLTSEEKAYNHMMERKNIVGHPAGLEWFCGKHLAAANKYSHLSYSEAMEILLSKPS